jgi:hypothetical protein
MDTEVNLLMTLRLLLLTHVCFVLVVNKFYNGEPGVTVVDVVTKSWGIDDCELDLELTLLELSLDNFNLCQFVQLLVVALVVVFRQGQFCREKGVD